jgi:hypothetical protein
MSAATSEITFGAGIYMLFWVAQWAELAAAPRRRGFARIVRAWKRASAVHALFSPAGRGRTRGARQGRPQEKRGVQGGSGRAARRERGGRGELGHHAVTVRCAHLRSTSSAPLLLCARCGTAWGNCAGAAGRTGQSAGDSDDPQDIRVGSAIRICDSDLLRPSDPKHCNPPATRAGPQLHTGPIPANFPDPGP